MQPVQVPPEIAALLDALDANAQAARTLVDGLSEDEGRWRPAPDAWSVAECLDHLAVANRVYLDAMREPAERARAAGRMRRAPALPGFLGRLFVNSLEPPAKSRTKRKAPGKIRPRESPGLRDSFNAFIASQEPVRAFLRDYANIDLAGVRFRNPFIGVIHFSLATGLHVITAHERRHLWQAAQVRARRTSDEHAAGGT
jgi:hypothetical protein